MNTSKQMADPLATVRTQLFPEMAPAERLEELEEQVARLERELRRLAAKVDELLANQKHLTIN
jgi:ubiquinone biosynthesis protein UbiJ